MAKPRYLGAFALKAKATAGLIYLLDLPKQMIAREATYQELLKHHSGKLIQTPFLAKRNLAPVTLSDSEDNEHTIVFFMQIPLSVGA
ncbi:NblA/ycf18 family protein [Nostoc sp. XA013]|nr:NblA/ycf18 family protein [Nostoc sp. XA013]